MPGQEGGSPSKTAGYLSLRPCHYTRQTANLLGGDLEQIRIRGRGPAY